MCILSGCDYLPNIPGIGIKKAYGLISKHKTLGRILESIEKSNKCIPQDYEQLFFKAYLTYCHQSVYDPIRNQLIPLSPIPDQLQLDSLNFLGPYIDKEIVSLIAQGELNPVTKKNPYENQNNNIQLCRSTELKKIFKNKNSPQRSNSCPSEFKYSKEEKENILLDSSIEINSKMIIKSRFFIKTNEDKNNESKEENTLKK